MRKTLIAFSFVACLLASLSATAQPSANGRRVIDSKVIAHRGYWHTKGSAENSLTSLSLALALNVYGSEIDVHLTKDGRVVVNHDGTRDGIELQKSTYKTCSQLKLANGEPLPLLDDMLKMLKKSDSRTKLVIELKEQYSHEHEMELVDAVLKLVKRHGVADRVEYISFSYEMCKALARKAPKAAVAFLEGHPGNKTPAEVNADGINGMDIHISTLREHPDWVDECHRLGMSMNVWTVDKMDDILEMEKLGVDYITTNNPTQTEW